MAGAFRYIFDFYFVLGLRDGFLLANKLNSQVILFFNKNKTVVNRRLP